MSILLKKENNHFVSEHNRSLLSSSGLSEDSVNQILINISSASRNHNLIVLITLVSLLVFFLFLINLYVILLKSFFTLAVFSLYMILYVLYLLVQEIKSIQVNRRTVTYILKHQVNSKQAKYLFSVSLLGTIEAFTIKPLSINKQLTEGFGNAKAFTRKRDFDNEDVTFNKLNKGTKDNSEKEGVLQLNESNVIEEKDYSCIKDNLFIEAKDNEHGGFSNLIKEENVQDIESSPIKDFLQGLSVPSLDTEVEKCIDKVIVVPGLENKLFRRRTPLLSREEEVIIEGLRLNKPKVLSFCKLMFFTMLVFLNEMAFKGLTEIGFEAQDKSGKLLIKIVADVIIGLIVLGSLGFTAYSIWHGVTERHDILDVYSRGAFERFEYYIDCFSFHDVYMVKVKASIDKEKKEYDKMRRLMKYINQSML